MLVGLNFKKSDPKDHKEDFGIEVAQSVGSRTRVFEAKNVDEYFEVLKDYSPSKRDNLVLINTHLDFEEDMSEGMWRATDLAFNQKGGVIYGEEPSRPSSVYKTRFVTENIDFMTGAAQYYEQRAKSAKKELKDYIGRVDSDPHTLILGFSPSWPRLSVSADALLAGLPEGSDAPWWWGVGFYNRRNQKNRTPEETYSTILERFRYSSRIVVSDTAQDVMDSLGEPYQRADNIRFNTIPAGVKYGRELRGLARLDSERVVV